jgi:hypothetical protein
MKNKLLYLFLSFFSYYLSAQEAVVATGSNATGNGTVSYTVGQLSTATQVGTNGIVVNGVQQNISLFTLSILTPEKLEALTYPNPAKDFVIISFNQLLLENMTFVFYDMTGKELLNGKIKKEINQISLKDISTGIYILNIYHQQKKIKQFKILKN